MEIVLVQVFNGLISGAFYALLSLGLAIIFGMLRVVNFMHGALYMLGAFGAYLLGTQLGVSFWWALIVSPLAVAAVGFLLERTLLRRLYELNVLYNLLLTFGLTLVIQDAMRLRFGIQGVPYSIPPQLRGAVLIGFMFFPTYRLFVLGFSVLVCLGVWWLIERTRAGMIIRASTEHPVPRGGCRPVDPPGLRLRGRARGAGGRAGGADAQRLAADGRGPDHHHVCDRGDRRDGIDPGVGGDGVLRRRALGAGGRVLPAGREHARLRPHGGRAAAPPLRPVRQS